MPWTPQSAAGTPDPPPPRAHGPEHAPAGTRLALVARHAEADGIGRLLAACAERGVTASVLHPACVPPPQARGAPELCLARLPAGTPPGLLGALLVREAQGQAWIDPPSALARVHDKAALLAGLLLAGFPAPPTVVVTRDGPTDLDELPGELLVIKPADGSAGRGVTVGLSRDQAARQAAAFAEACGPVLVQPVLGAGLDRRLFVVGARVVAAMERRPAATGRGNLLYGAIARAIDPEPGEVELATRVAAHFGLDLAGIDLLVEGSAHWVLEVNACPGFKGIEAATGLDLAGAVAELVRSRLSPPPGEGQSSSRGAAERR